MKQSLSISSTNSEEEPIKNHPEPRKEKKPTVTREKWANRSEFYLSCAGGFIGLGNVWRFPYLCYDNGGALFFIPYIIFFIFVGIPIFFLEVCVGQYTSQGGITAWSMLAPITTGIGYGSIILTSVINIYYIVVLGWAIYYMFASFDSNENLIKKWGTCDNSWNDPTACQADVKAATNVSAKGLYISPIEEYFEKQVLNIADEMTFETLTNVNWNMVLCVLGGWMLCYFCVWKGVKCTGKVVMFTATFPLFMLTVLVIRGVTLDGASKGIEFYLIPKGFDKLYESKIWVEAGTQILYTFALCKGALLSLGSYNKFHTNCYKDVFILACMNSFVSFVAGFAIFSVLGFMAVSHDVEVADVAKSGPGLAFIAFPQAILEMPAYQNFWAILFFFMILLLGLDSQFVGLEAVATSFSDIYTSLRKPGRREMFLLGIVLISQILAIPLCSSGGMYLFKLYDYYGASGFCLLFLSFSQCIAVAYIYGGDKMWRNVTEMVGFEPSRRYILLCWKFITPAICFATTAIKILKFKSLDLPRPLGKVFKYSTSQEAIGWFIGGLSMFPVVYFIIYKAFYRNGTIATSLRQIIRNLRHNLEAKDKRIQHSVFVMKRSPSEISLNSLDSSDTVEKIEIDMKDIK